MLSDTALQFNTVLGDMSQYVRIGGGNVLALHLRAGAVFSRNFGASTTFVPPQERLYAGGPSSVRGFAQNELGAAHIHRVAVSIRFRRRCQTASVVRYFRADQDSTPKPRRVVPVGGNTIAVANLGIEVAQPDSA